MCYIYNDDRERREIMTAFIESAFVEGEQVYYAASGTDGDQSGPDMRRFDADMPPATQSAFQLSDAGALYCPDGRFEPERMLGCVRSLYRKSVADGFRGARGSGEMGWALQNPPGVERLVEYEALLNTLAPSHPVTLICQYDARRFDGASLFQIIAVHPAMIVRGQVLRNPYYIPPDRYLTAPEPAASTGERRVRP